MHSATSRSRAARYVPDLSQDAAARAVAAMGLIGVGIIHALEIQGQLGGAGWLTAGFGLLAVAAPGCGLWLLAWPGPSPWRAGGLLCMGTAAGYILTRSIPLPGDRGDAGNWLEPLGLTALIIETIVALLAVLVLASRARDARVPAPWNATIRAGETSRKLMG